jgi:uncharacterized protein (DUF1697 family)
MPRYVALLRGVSPMNAKMPELKQAFASAGFTDVRTVLASGNVVFGTRATDAAAIARKAEAAMARQLGKSFPTLVRSLDDLRALLAANPYGGAPLPTGAKRVVTFLRTKPPLPPSLPIELDGARIVAMRGREVFTVYVRSAKGPVFMRLIESTFGKDVTTRTWETVTRLARE